jgi:hypothetical protein
MQAAQLLAATLPSILVPTPTQTQTTSAATAAALYDPDMPVEGPLDEEEEPMQQYHIEVPPPLLGTTS